ncbi:ABC transporter ATP-binding protein [Orrella sp. 11846]|uniref:ABC transporter ATP-binding protein n=1 Tax=Orrella sp. 11846 TaxID=3409913 RepID=UPI003B5AE038
MVRLRVSGLTKVFPSTVANEDVSLEVRAGEIHAVLGENGAGKSTLMKMIYGVTEPTAGEIIWEGQVVQLDNPAQARALGIGMVFQHFSLFETLTVAQNTVLALDGNPDTQWVANEISRLSEHYGLSVNPHDYVHDLSLGERQRVEIIRCLLQNPKLLIMDEPTSVLTPAAVQQLFKTLRQIRDEGCAILYISHKLEEIMALCDTATVLRHGRVSGRCQPAEESARSLARMMIGHDFEAPIRTQVPSGPVRLTLRSVALDTLTIKQQHDATLELSARQGRVLGIAGISGNGQTQLLQLINGEQQVAQATIEFDGQRIEHLGVQARRDLGIGSVPEDRQMTAALPSLTLAENTLLTAGRRKHLVKRGFVSRRAMHDFAQACIDLFDVKASGPQALARSLSGGNLQKFILAREILQNPKLLICAQPTWGVDVGAAAQIRQALIDLARQGCAVIVLSEDLDELFEMSDEICVIAQGRLSPVVAVQDTDVAQLGAWMGGSWPDQKKDAHATAA